MRKLGNTFSKKYNFKRLLQTAPDLAKLYNKQESAVNGITPIRFIQLKEKDGPIEACNLTDPVDVEMFGPAQPIAWPCRIKYAEQIYDLNAHGFECVWTVRIVEKSNGGRIDRIETSIRQVPNPMVVTFFPDNLGPLIPVNDAHRMVEPEHLSKIDGNKRMSFFLSDRNPKNTPTELNHCGIIPNNRHLWNATFYDYDVAHLYAESMDDQLRKSDTLV